MAGTRGGCEQGCESTPGSETPDGNISLFIGGLPARPPPKKKEEASSKAANNPYISALIWFAASPSAQLLGGLP